MWRKHFISIANAGNENKVEKRQIANAESQTQVSNKNVMTHSIDIQLCVICVEVEIISMTVDYLGIRCNIKREGCHMIIINTRCYF